MTFAGYPGAIQSAATKLGAPYLLGGKWDPALFSTIGPVDCSGFSRWVLARAGLVIPDGSYNQIAVCKRLPDSMQRNPPALALGFYGPPQGVVDHVIVSMGAGVVIEARGAPYNCVICRPVVVWCDWPGFLGFYSPPGLDLAGAA